MAGLENNMTTMETWTNTEVPTPTPFDWYAYYMRLIAMILSDRAFHKYWQNVYDWCATVVVLVSVVANSLSILVFATKKSKKEQTVNMLLISLAISDSFALTFNWEQTIFFWTGYSMSRSSNVMCKLINYIPYCARDYSSYIILAFTLDRFVSVKFPLKKSTIINKKRVKIYLAIVIVIFAAMEGYVLYYVEIASNGQCMTVHPHKFSRLTTFLQNLIGFIVPATIVFIFNIQIIFQLRKWAAKRLKMTGQDEKEGASQNTALTVLLVGISTFSFLVAMPRVVTHYYNEYASINNRRAYYKAIYITSCIRILNFSCNFFFYCLSGSQFRNDLSITLRRVFCCQAPPAYRPSTSTATGSTAASVSTVSRAINETKMSAAPPAKA